MPTAAAQQRFFNSYFFEEKGSFVLQQVRLEE
jgi:hypothetical protein